MGKIEEIEINALNCKPKVESSKTVGYYCTGWNVPDKKTDFQNKLITEISLPKEFAYGFGYEEGKMHPLIPSQVTIKPSSVDVYWGKPIHCTLIRPFINEPYDDIYKLECVE